MAADSSQDELPGAWEITYEYQRYYPRSGWSDALLPTDRARWSTETGIAKDPEFVQLEFGWEWASDWEVDVDYGRFGAVVGEDDPDDDPGTIDEDGWRYAKGMKFGFHLGMGRMDYVRRRRWIRRRLYIGPPDLLQVIEDEKAAARNAPRIGSGLLLGKTRAAGRKVATTISATRLGGSSNNNNGGGGGGKADEGSGSGEVGA